MRSGPASTAHPGSGGNPSSGFPGPSSGSALYTPWPEAGDRLEVGLGKPPSGGGPAPDASPARSPVAPAESSRQIVAAALAAGPAAGDHGAASARASPAARAPSLAGAGPAPPCL